MCPIAAAALAEVAWLRRAIVVVVAKFGVVGVAAWTSERLSQLRSWLTLPAATCLLCDLCLLWAPSFLLYNGG